MEDEDNNLGLLGGVVNENNEKNENNQETDNLSESTIVEINEKARKTIYICLLILFSYFL